jgi:hypothetical protein
MGIGRDDFGKFLDRWAHVADTLLGWQPSDLLGWDPATPYSPIAKVPGIIWKFDGATAVEVTRDAITTTCDTYRKLRSGSEVDPPPPICTA